MPSEDNDIGGGRGRFILTAVIAESQLPVANVLNNIEAELLLVGQLLARLQVAFSPLLHTEVCTNEFHRDVQSLDFMTQQIQQLAIVMSNLASKMAPEWLMASEDVVVTLTLQALADRICGYTVENTDKASGDFEIL